MNEKCLRMRWMDDVIMIVDKYLPMRLKRRLRRMTKKTFYGEGLILERVREKEAFGFTWDAQDGYLEVRPIEKYARIFGSRWLKKSMSGMYCGTQFATEKEKQGVVQGYITRMMETTNANGHEVEEMLRRLGQELRTARFSRKTVETVL